MRVVGSTAKIPGIRYDIVILLAPGRPSSGMPDVSEQDLASFSPMPASGLPTPLESTTSFEIHRSSDTQTDPAIQHFGLATMERSVRQVCAPARWRTANWELPGLRRTGPDRD